MDSGPAANLMNGSPKITPSPVRHGIRRYEHDGGAALRRLRINRNRFKLRQIRHRRTIRRRPRNSNRLRRGTALPWQFRPLCRSDPGEPAISCKPSPHRWQTRSANRLAAASPMPALPPVITAVFPSNSLVMTLSVEWAAPPPVSENMIHPAVGGYGLDRI